MVLALTQQTFSVPFRRTNRAFGSLSSFVGDKPNAALKYLLNPSHICESDWPIILFGPSGTGKTELAYSIVNDLLFDPCDKPLFLTAVEFSRSYRSAIETDSTKEFRSKFIKSLGLVIDHLDDMARFPKSQLELVYVIDQLARRNIPLVFTASDSFSASDKLLPQLISRLSSGLCLPVNPPGVDALKIIIRQLSKIHSIDLTDDALEYLLVRLPVTVPRINQFFIQFTASTSSVGLVDRSELECYFGKSFALDIDNFVQKVLLLVSREFSLSITDITGNSRKQTIALARSITVYFLRNLLNLSFTNIGVRLGNRDHSTIMHAYKKANKITSQNNSSTTVPATIFKLELKINEALTAYI